MEKLSRYIIVLLTLGVMGCDQWLNLGSEDRIMENDLFLSEKGFITALNGVYIGMTNRNLYGGKLSFELGDILAQIYDCSNENHFYKTLSQFNENRKRNDVAEVWGQCYYNLHAVNTILEHCETERHVLSDLYYQVIKGEAFALRALLHFELLRIFGPVYAINSGDESIIYMESSDSYLRPLLRASEVVSLIRQDLMRAEDYLMEYDPIVESGPMFSNGEGGVSNAMRYRTVRMNYYAVLGLTARIAHYMGDNETALHYARRVIDEGVLDKKWFMFASRQQAEGGGNIDEDRVYQSEILFGIHHSKRHMIYDNTFSKNVNKLNVLQPSNKMRQYFYDNQESDLRLRQWQMLTEFNSQNREVTNTYFVKYMAVDDGGIGFGKIIPVIRISEMYLIIAESSDNTEERLEAINTIREARKIYSLVMPLDLDRIIEKEFRREFIGEGQMFWFYKRRNAKFIPDDLSYENKVEMSPQYYLFQLPDSEQNQRINY